ncbi:flagellar hook-associated protein FlgL [Roseicyclus mahoneyensis]|uniref:Flagellar hook-associated protein 3 FlgL n=1 Tax=Roseicyclus mahoneyensis TaxID=164332 RepID=A0A316GJH9_9RHOB|nr:flagellar hook-associated protein FlgL [Roseicyclus mahoneyensis]PWK60417.1 flagellar hook-associated protein 3 FlgL [Roseicyclus mahoneyensis]
MTLGTSLFHSLNTAAFGRLDTKIADLQTRISEGRNDPRPSSDLGRAARLSAAEDQRALLARFSTTIDRATERLTLTDTTLAEISTVTQRLGEIALRGASASTPDTERVSLATELSTLRKTLVDLGNARDATGRPLFSGYRAGVDPFVEGPHGVSYQGDGGKHRLRVSESARIATGLNGAEVFMGIPDATGARRDLFGMIDDLARTLGRGGNAMVEATRAKGALTLTPDLTRTAADWGLTIEGPQGTARIEVALVAGALGPAVEAINAQAAATGVTATLDEAGTGLVLSAAGSVGVSRLSVSPARGGIIADAGGVPMLAEGRGADALVAGLRNAAEHIADRRAEVGALGAAAERQGELVTRRQTELAGVMAGLEDLDVVEAVTRLQELMLTRQVSQQSYVKIGQSTLFDWLR